MKAYYYSFVSDLLGEIYLAFTSRGLVRLSLYTEDKKDFFNWLKIYFDEISEYRGKELEFSLQIKSYLKGKLKKFDIPVEFYGTEFQKRVWKQLFEIPYGSVKSYKDIALAIGKPKGFRAVGGANNKNPIPIVVPCHRVINNNGEIGGYRGGIDCKVKLLKLEGVKIEAMKEKYIVYQ
ncbi:methylated-DNA-[protein]-cysteine S-methyltransferase [Caloranaerobacter azorensis DSM 13643]|uniref:Methylated-DNA--protein-cysteine methyltransferase n=1 Tax=Caloranaerobacter azorensis DSM 13643 TaxID=1121264 RepID=A0A1M5UBM2_9FIRM|nr:methylated-DNA--[protein]-cysteine S-methyltransferase [Caloranaerobacter azorensis]SHH60311.1 methylated-DNA-[protein]-cysteine S-methyltransferase [Caloranaerobacter azorensis DSM 13643]